MYVEELLIEVIECRNCSKILNFFFSKMKNTKDNVVCTPQIFICIIHLSTCKKTQNMQYL